MLPYRGHHWQQNKNLIPLPDIDSALKNPPHTSIPIWFFINHGLYINTGVLLIQLHLIHYQDTAIEYSLEPDT